MRVVAGIAVLNGARFFQAKGCVRCHAINGIGGTEGWCPRWTPRETADLVAFLRMHGYAK